MAAIASAFSTPSAVSIWQKKVVRLVGGDEFVLDRPGPVAVMGDLQGHATPAVGRYFMQLTMMARLLRAADHGQHHALGAHIRRARDMVVLLRGHAHDRGQIRCLEIAERALHGLETEAGMLQIEEHEIATGRFQDMPDAGRGEFDDEMPELRVPAAGQVP